MPPRLRLRPARPLGLARTRLPLCMAQTTDRRTTGGLSSTWTFYSTSASSTSSTSTSSSSSPRAALAAALVALQTHASALANEPRLQLALRGLQQPPGNESVRVAILGLGPAGGATAKQLLHLVLADPLQDVQPWEERLAAHDVRQPLIVRVQPVAATAAAASDATAADDNLLTTDGTAQLVVPSAVLGASQLEFLLLARDSLPAPPRTAAGFEATAVTAAEAALVPEVVVPGVPEPVATPVHQTVLVAKGWAGAGVVAAGVPADQQDAAEVLGAVALRVAVEEEDNHEATPVQSFDGTAATDAVALFRQSVAHATAYEALWRQSGLPPIVQWLRAGAAPRPDGTTKAPLRRLVASLLAHTRTRLAAVDDDLQRRQTAAAAPFVTLDGALAAWAEQAHAELQQQLDLAFGGGRWRQLGWWKLFWRVDDVGMLAGGLVAQRFLLATEQHMVYLAGRIEEAAAVGAGDRESVTYAGPTVEAEAEDTTTVATRGTMTTATTPPPPSTPWPTHIAFTRTYLLDTTVPALQALAQRLVLQTASTTGLTTALAVLAHLASVGVYEAGTVAAVGLVWSLGRMQRRWEAARTYWEAEVREEGRKAVRAAETAAAQTLRRTRAAATGTTDRARVRRELDAAGRLVDAAEAALEKLP